jgi:hypothetical protein
VAPAARIANNNAGFTAPSLLQGVHTTISGQPATRASVIVMIAVDTSGAVPPGM